MANDMEMNFVLKFVASDLTSGVKKANGDLKTLREGFEKALASLPGGKNISAEVQKANDEITKLIKKIDVLQSKGKTRLLDATPKQAAAIMGGSQSASSAIMAARPEAIEAKRVREQSKALQDMNVAMNTAVFGTDALAKHAITLRYALYDVSSIAQNLSQTMLGFAANAISAAANQEKAFSQVQKTLGDIDPSKLTELEDQLVKMSMRMPLKFDDLAKIAMLGSQMNVPAEGIKRFTEVIAKFTAVSQMPVEDAAAQLGKLSNILNLNPDASQYEALASAIAYVGNESASTEKEVLRTAGQIAAVGVQAGLSASQVVGLSGAFASLAIRPEEARGVIVQMFNSINEAAASFVPAVNKGSDALAVFAKIAGVSQAEFSSMWSSKTATEIDKFGNSTSKAAVIWQQFTKNLGDTKNGYDTAEVLRKLGLDGIRTSKGITALASNFGVLAVQMENASKQGRLADFLDTAYGAIAEDLASKITELQNSFEALNASIGGNSALSTMLGFFVDVIKNIVAGLTEMNKSPVGQFVSTLVLALTGLVGILASAAAMLALGGAGFLAFRTAVVNAATAEQFMTEKGLRLMLSLAGVSKASIDAAVAARAAAGGFVAAGQGAEVGAVGVRIFGLSLKSLLVSTGIGVLVLLVGALVEGIISLAEAGNNAGNALDKPMETAKKFQEQLQKTRQELLDFFDAINDNRDTTRSLQNAFYALGKAAYNGGKGLVDGTQAARDFDAAAETAVKAAVGVYGNKTQELANFLGSFITYLKATGTATASTIAGIQNELNSLNLAVTGPSTFDFAKYFGEGFKDIGDRAGGAAKQVDTLLEKIQKALKLLNASYTLSSSLRDLGAALKEGANSFSRLSDKGQASMSALNGAIESVVESTGQKTQVTANRLMALRTAMYQSGVTAKVAFTAINTAIAQTGKVGKASSKDIKEFLAQLTTGATEAVKKNVRSIYDWASDIDSIMSKAFTFRYDKQVALDNITKAWSNLTREVNDAKDAIDEANRSITKIASDNRVLEYQLQVAIRYGDTLRADQIRAKIAANADATVKAQKDIADAQVALNKSLDPADTSDAAVKNRSDVLSLVQTYQNYLRTIATTTTDSAKLSEASKNLTDDFLAQGQKLGFSKTELAAFTTALNTDFVTAIKNAPKDITLNIQGIDPAIAAVADFVSRMNVELAKIDVIDVSGNVVSVDANANQQPQAPITKAPASVVNAAPIKAPVSTPTSSLASNQASIKAAADAKAAKLAADARAAEAARLKALIKVPTKSEIIAYQAKIEKIEEYSKEDNGWTAFFNPRRYNFVHDALKGLRVDVAAFNSTYGNKYANMLIDTKLSPGYASGGFVSGAGTGTSDSIAARLSNGEFVMRANAVKSYGVDFMNALNDQKVTGFSPAGASSGAGSSGVVYLSPEDRSLLRQAIDRPIALYTENTKIAQSANTGNVILAQRGSK